MVEELSTDNIPHDSPRPTSIWDWFFGPYNSDICHIRGVYGLF
jgi:hypothetical protein